MNFKNVIKMINTKYINQLILIIFYQLWVIYIENGEDHQIINEYLIIVSSALLALIQICIKKQNYQKSSKTCLNSLILRMILVVIIVFQPNFSNATETSTLIKGYFLGSQFVVSRLRKPSIFESAQRNQKNNCKIVLQLWICVSIIIYCNYNLNNPKIYTCFWFLLLYCIGIQFSVKIIQGKNERLNGEVLQLGSNKPNTRTDLNLQHGSMNGPVLEDKIKFFDHSHQIHSFTSPMEIKSDFQQQASLYLQEKQLLKTSFYRDILRSFPDGLIIMDSNKDILFVGKALLLQMSTNNKNQAVQNLMCLRNCQGEFLRQTKMAKLFTNFIKKINSSKNISSSVEPDFHQNSIDDDEAQINFNFDSFVSESDTVKNEFEKIISGYQSDKFQQIDKTLNFRFEVNMICSRQGSLQKIEALASNSSRDKNQLFQISFRPFYHQNKLQILLIVKDVTHFNQIRVLQTINENKSSMLSQVAHEFRTPLNCIILLIQALLPRSPENINNIYLQPVLTSAKGLLSMIQDLLDFAQLNAGKFRLIQAEFNIKDLFNQLKTLLLPNVQLKGNKILIEIDDSLTIVVSDQNRISQILINLIGNSAKFTTNGSVTIGAKQISDELIEIYVNDTGIGIEPEDQKKLFEAFSKLEHGKEMNDQGVGLGLMISNQIANKLSQSDFGYEFNTATESESSGLKVFSQGKNQGSKFSFLIFNQTPNSSSQQFGTKKQYQSRKKMDDMEASIRVNESYGCEGSINHGQKKEMNPDKQYSYGCRRKKVSFEILSSQQQDVKGVSNKNYTDFLISTSKQFEQSILEKLIQIQSPSASILYKQLESIQISGIQQDKITKSQISPMQQSKQSEKLKQIGLYCQRSCDCAEILIIDDEAFNIFALKQHLQSYQMKIDEAYSGIQGVKKVQDYELIYICNKNFDCRNYKIIIMDLEMPGGDGIKTTQDILKLKNAKYTNIIGCSAHDSLEVEQKCLQAGMIGYLSKPVDIPKLLRLIKKILG